MKCNSHIWVHIFYFHKMYVLCRRRQEKMHGMINIFVDVCILQSGTCLHAIGLKLCIKSNYYRFATVTLLMTNLGDVNTCMVVTTSHDIVFDKGNTNDVQLLNYQLQQLSICRLFSFLNLVDCIIRQFVDVWMRKPAY